MQPGWKLKEGAGEEEAKEGGNGGGGETTFFNGVLPRGGSPRAMKLVAWNSHGLNSTRMCVYCLRHIWIQLRQKKCDGGQALIICSFMRVMVGVVVS